MERILITGASGLLGSNLLLLLSAEAEVAGTYHRHSVVFPEIETFGLDLTNFEEVEAAVDRLAPAVVIHCAAETRVDHCERNPDHAFSVNSEGTRNLVRVVAESSAMFVYISTDSVFDGTRGSYSETDAPSPLNAYAASKLQGEQAVEEMVKDYLIIRTNLYGWSPSGTKSLTEWAFERLRTGRSVPGFADVFFTPFLVNDLSEVVSGMIRSGLRGLYHVASKERLSKFRFLQMLAEVFRCDEKLVESSCSSAADLTAVRPKDTSLCAEKVIRDLKLPMSGVREGLERLHGLYNDGLPDVLRSGVVCGGAAL